MRLAIVVLCVFTVYVASSRSYLAEALIDEVGDKGSVGQIPEGCVSMSALTSMVFQQSMTQNRRRSSNVPTLQCVGNCPADAPTLSQAHCTKQGSDDYGRPTWKCVPQFANGNGGDTKGLLYGLGSVRVECEGCEKKGDSNVIQGSCSLKYSITVGGQNKAHSKRLRHHYGEAYHRQHNDVIAALVWLIFGITTIAATVAICRSCRPNYYPTNAKNEYVTDAQGNIYGAPMYANGGAPPAVHHHYGGGGSGFGTGMLTGFVVGDLISRAHHPYSYYGGYGYEGAAAEYAGGFNGIEGGGGFDASGWGGTDSI